MNRKIVIAGIVLLALAFVAAAADVTGKWTSEQPGRNGGAPRVTTYDLKAEGGKLTGTVTAAMGRGEPTPIQITNGKIDGDKISFEVTRDFNGTPFTTKYEFTAKGDTMTGKVTRPGMNGGDPTTTDITAKRATT